MFWSFPWKDFTTPQEARWLISPRPVTLTLVETELAYNISGARGKTFGYCFAVFLQRLFFAALRTIETEHFDP
jgi:hypothetical protein